MGRPALDPPFLHTARLSSGRSVAFNRACTPESMGCTMKGMAARPSAVGSDLFTNSSILSCGMPSTCEAHSDAVCPMLVSCKRGKYNLLLVHVFCEVTQHPARCHGGRRRGSPHPCN